MPNRNSLEAIKRRYKWHNVNILATTGSDIGSWPSIDYTKHKHPGGC